ncbi:MAG: division/cell wall cluster transcriptional repressor MraZ [Chloroflexus sp.]
MLLGTWQVSLEEQGRLMIPRPLRQSLHNGLVITRGFERCLQLCPAPFWQSLTQQVHRLSLGGTDERWLRRLLFAEADATTLDEQGAITISLPLRDYAGLYHAGVLVGMDQYLELWSPERWQECQATILATAGHWSRRDWAIATSPRSAVSL